MVKTLSLHDPIEIRVAYHRARSRTWRLVHEATTLAIGCVAATLLALSLYLVAPAELREGILAAFLGLDQPAVTAPSAPPLSL